MVVVLPRISNDIPATWSCVDKKSIQESNNCIKRTDVYKKSYMYICNWTILTEDYLSNIKGDSDYAWQLKESFLESLDEIKDYDQQADQADTDQKGTTITTDTTESLSDILTKLGRDPYDIAEKYANVDYEANKNVPSLQSLITYYQLIFDQPASIFARTHSLKTLNDLLPELSIGYKGE